MKIQFSFPVFPDHTTPKGALPREKAAQACWYFYLMAQKMEETAGDTESQIRLEGELWRSKHYVQLARSVALIYGLESPDVFARHWDSVREEARNCHLPEPRQEYTRVWPGMVIQ